MKVGMLSTCASAAQSWWFEIKECLTPEEESIITSKEFEDAYYAGLEAENNNSDTNEDVPDVVMRLYLEVFQNYPDKADDVEFITNKYIEFISASNELTAEEKEIIYSALSVAASSYEYWENSLKWILLVVEWQ